MTDNNDADARKKEVYTIMKKLMRHYKFQKMAMSTQLTSAHRKFQKKWNGNKKMMMEIMQCDLGFLKKLSKMEVK